MPDKLVGLISKPILSLFDSRSQMFSLFEKLDTGPEEWFRVEILNVIEKLDDIEILATNQRHLDIPGRPDFVLLHGGVEKIVELKVLPVDRNYKSGYQRFCAGKTNKADFDALANGEVTMVIYIHWPNLKDFNATKNNLEKRYAVSCHSSSVVNSGAHKATVSFWVRKNA